MGDDPIRIGISDLVEQAVHEFLQCDQFPLIQAELPLDHANQL